MESQETAVGIVIPTLGTRLDFLLDCVESVREAGPAHLTIVCDQDARQDLESHGVHPDQWVDDPGGGAARAINVGVRSLPPSIRFVGWIGDDDLLEKDSLASVTREFVNGVVAVFGACRYVDHANNVLFVNKSGRMAVWLMKYGPNLVPQPGSLIDRKCWESIDGLDESLKWTFDLDLFIKLSQLGHLIHIPRILASFRWHDDSLTAGAREGSVIEASLVRVRSMPRFLGVASRCWEPLVRFAILKAGARVTKRVERLQRKNEAP